jgi:hypothetical protein
MIDDNRKKRKLDEAEDERWSAAELLGTEVRKVAPPSLALPAPFQKNLGPDNAVACNRPFEGDTLPLALLHEAFVMFKSQCEEASSDKGLACFSSLTLSPCKWYESEIQRRQEIQDILSTHLILDFPVQKIPGTESTTD